MYNIFRSWKENENLRALREKERRILKPKWEKKWYKIPVRCNKSSTITIENENETAIFTLYVATLIQFNFSFCVHFTSVPSYLVVIFSFSLAQNSVNAAHNFIKIKKEHLFWLLLQVLNATASGFKNLLNWLLVFITAKKFK